MTNPDALLKLADFPVLPAAPAGKPWRVLIVDDEQGIHQVTELALRDVQVVGRSIKFLHAYSGAEAREMLKRETDIALILLDVVMETDQAGLELVDFIRNELRNHIVRIILRTGQPGQAPERDVIIRYDINGYKHKAELTTTKLFSTVYTAIAAYRDLMALQHSRQVYRQILEFATRLRSIQDVTEIAKIALTELASLLYLDDAAMCAYSALAAVPESDPLEVLVATGEFASMRGNSPAKVLPDQVKAVVRQAMAERHSIFGEGQVTGYCETARGFRVVLHIQANAPMSLAPSDRELVDMFCTNVAFAIESVRGG